MTSITELIKKIDTYPDEIRRFLVLAILFPKKKHEITVKVSEKGFDEFIVRVNDIITILEKDGFDVDQEGIDTEKCDLVISI